MFDEADKSEWKGGGGGPLGGMCDSTDINVTITASYIANVSFYEESSTSWLKDERRNQIGTDFKHFLISTCRLQCILISWIAVFGP